MSPSAILGDVRLPPNFKMAESYSTTSLDYWRKFFNCANTDIFQVIKYAILVASADYPTEFLSWRDQITEVLYNCWSMQCSSDQAELQAPPEGVLEDDESSEDASKESKESKSSSSSSSSEEDEPTISNELSTSYRPEHANLDEFEALTDEIEEEQQTVGEVLRIKGLLTNWREESEKVLSESLRRLQLMELSVETLSATDIGRAVIDLEKHKSKPIRQLAQTLVRGWKLLAEEWVTAATVSQEPSPISIEPSPATEESFLPSELDFPPLDMGALLATQTATFEFSKFFEGMDEDGNITNTRDKKNERKPQQKDSNSIRKGNVDVWRQDLQKDSNLMRKSNGEVSRQDQQKDCNLVRKGNGELRSQEVPKARKPTDATHKSSKPKNVPSPPMHERPSTKATACRNTEQRQKMEDNSGVLRTQEVAPRAPKPINAPSKASKPQDIPINQVPGRPSSRGTAHRNTQQRQKPSGVPSKPCPSRKDVSKESEELSYRDKLEAAKRKLHDRYQEVKDAKRQRTIQVMELKDLPKLGQSKLQPNMMKRGNYFNRYANMKSK